MELARVAESCRERCGDPSRLGLGAGGLDPLQMQPVWRGGRAGGATVLRVQHVFDRFGAVSIKTYFYERANDDPDHLPEKARALDPEHQLRFSVGKFTMQNRADRTVPSMAGFGEAGEIVFADEILRGLAHCIDVQWLPAVPGEVGE